MIELITLYNSNFKSKSFSIKDEKVLTFYPYITDILKYTILEDNNHVNIMISDNIYMDDEIVRTVLDLPYISDLPLKEISYKLIYKGLPLIDFLGIDINEFKDLTKILYKQIENVTNLSEYDKLYLVAIMYKSYGNINSKIYDIFDFTEDKEFDINFINEFDSDFIADITWKMYHHLYSKINHKFFNKVTLEKNKKAIDRFNKLFTTNILDIIDPLYTNNAIIAGGLANICLDETIDIKNITTDIDIFLFGDEMNQKHFIKNVIYKLIKHFGGKNIYVYHVPSIKYIWISDTNIHIQLIGTRCKSPYEVVMNFDMSHVRCWYDGNNFYQTIDCEQSIMTKTTYSLILPKKNIRHFKAKERGYNIRFVNESPWKKLDTIYEIQQDMMDIYYKEDEIILRYKMVREMKLYPISDNSIIRNKINISLLGNTIYENIINFENYDDIPDLTEYKISPTHKYICQILENHRMSYSFVSDYTKYTNKIYQDLDIFIPYKKNIEFSGYNLSNHNILSIYQLSYNKDDKTEWVRINIGKTYLANIVQINHIGHDVKTTIAIIYLGEIKNVIYERMNKLYNLIKKNHISYKRNQNSQNKLITDKYNVNINEYFVLSPQDLLNYSKNIIGPYLVCRVYNYSSFNQLNPEIGGYIKSTLYFRVSIINKEVIKIYPVLNTW